MHDHPYRKEILKDLFILVIAITITISLIESGYLDSFLLEARRIPILGSFVAGFFFTSVFTVSLSSVFLANIAQTYHLPVVVLMGALGAVISDLVLFLFIKERVVKNVENIVSEAPSVSRIFKSEMFRFLDPIIGALFIASPLPDEIGLVILGLAHVSAKRLAIITFVLHSIGIFIVASIGVVLG
jgi:uncharacterized membrane protein YdjX (TVP38/TMEM64 family)